MARRARRDRSTAREYVFSPLGRVTFVEEILPEREIRPPHVFRVPQARPRRNDAVSPRAGEHLASRDGKHG
jgi:hypothetical protein